MDILIIDVGRRLFQGTEKCGNNTEVREQKTLIVGLQYMCYTLKT